MKCRNWKNELVEAPADLEITQCTLEDGYLVWSYDTKGIHQVRYGLQVKTFEGYWEANSEFRDCFLHNMLQNNEEETDR